MRAKTMIDDVYNAQKSPRLCTINIGYIDARRIQHASARGRNFSCYGSTVTNRLAAWIL